MFYNLALDVFLPQRCVHCEISLPGGSPLCLKCYHQLPQTGWELDQNNRAFKQLRKIANIQGVLSLWFYSHNLVSGSLIRALKYNNQPEIGTFIAEIFMSKFNDNINRTKFRGIIPIPLHPKKLAIRGYNHLANFCQSIASKSGIPYLPLALGIKKYTSTQTRLNQVGRFHNRSQLFYLNEKLEKGHYLLVDDIITTGATIAASCEVLQSSGDVEISVISFAYTI